MMECMCQYSVSCPVGRHNPGTVCPYVGRGSSPGRARSVWATAPKPARTEPRRFRSAAVSSGISGADLLVVIIVAIAWDRFYKDTGIGGVVFAVLAVLLPFAIAAWLTSACTAWNGSLEGRCEKRRLGWQRCELRAHRRTSQLVTVPEAAAVLSIVVGIVNAVFLIGLAF